MASSRPGDDDGDASQPLASSPSRQTRSLLPPADIWSSSPLPRSNKRKHGDLPLDQTKTLKFYPTPIPTSSTNILSSSPSSRRPPLHRTTSVLSERAPLCSVPTAEVPSNGEPLLLGRSSNSSNYQFPTNRLISRVHIRASFHPRDAQHASGTVKIECLGWNGAQVHCRGQVYQLGKGDVFTSDRPSAEIMLDVQDTRVIVAWPSDAGTRSASVQSDRTWTENSPLAVVGGAGDRLASSPPRLAPRSPVSPTPGQLQPIVNASQSFIADVEPIVSGSGPVQVYEDPSSDPEPNETTMTGTDSRATLTNSSHPSSLDPSKTSQSSFLSNDDFSDHDEENDPIVHSFGPFGENILPRLQSVSTSSPSVPRSTRRQREPLRATSNSPQKRIGSEPSDNATGSGLGIALLVGQEAERAGSASDSDQTLNLNLSPIKNHVINQLAFSRVHAIPLSTIFGALPMELKTRAADSSSTGLTSPVLKQILEDIPCVGEIARAGKDAAGKTLENEYYYVPEMDADTIRQEAVTGSRGGGLRAVRKNHKVGPVSSLPY